jgi:hypothetical protein
MNESDVKTFSSRYIAQFEAMGLPHNLQVLLSCMKFDIKLIIINKLFRIFM